MAIPGLAAGASSLISGLSGSGAPLASAANQRVQNESNINFDGPTIMKDSNMVTPIVIGVVGVLIVLALWRRK